MWNLNILDDVTSLPNKAGETYARLYHQDWRSDMSLQVDGGGANFRGFMGNYTVTILKGSTILTEFQFQLHTNTMIACEGGATGLTCTGY